ncbi:MAG: hypothetical protein D6814_04490 [Calditrichaeota bacterium]|nr:MAG: hypothetical protein D6814_04490 [Calditrichota bacterium]
MVTKLRNRQTKHLMVRQLWKMIKKKYGKDPFKIAARQDISIILHEAEETAVAHARDTVSLFRPDSMTIHIYAGALGTFWDSLFPGCPLELRYQYVCWRELWNYWLSNHFAPIQNAMGKKWRDYLQEFACVSLIEREYLSHYFASLATGVLVYDPEIPRV